jgi:hypothetical protein
MVELVGSMPRMDHSESIQVLQSGMASQTSRKKLAIANQGMWHDSPCDKININYEEFFEPAYMDIKRKVFFWENKNFRIYMRPIRKSASCM